MGIQICIILIADAIYTTFIGQYYEAVAAFVGAIGWFDSWIRR